MPLEYIRAEGKAGRLGARLMAIVALRDNAEEFISRPIAEHEQSRRGRQAPDDIPDTDLPKQALGFRVQNYGMTKHRQLFTNRQLLALATFCNLVGEARVKVFEDPNGTRAMRMQ